MNWRDVVFTDRRPVEVPFGFSQSFTAKQDHGKALIVSLL